MKMEEKGGRRTLRRGNVLDIVIILLLAAALAGIAYRYYETSTPDSKSTKKYVVDFEVREVRPNVGEAIKDEETVYLAEDGVRIGTLISSATKISPARVMLTDEDGTYVTTILPAGNKVDVRGSLNVVGRSGKSGIFLLNGERPLSPGESIAAVTEKASFSLVVVAIREAE